MQVELAIEVVTKVETEFSGCIITDVDDTLMNIVDVESVVRQGDYMDTIPDFVCQVHNDVRECPVLQRFGRDSASTRMPKNAIL